MTGGVVTTTINDLECALTVTASGSEWYSSKITLDVDGGDGGFYEYETFFYENGANTDATLEANYGTD